MTSFGKSTTQHTEVMRMIYVVTVTTKDWRIWVDVGFTSYQMQCPKTILQMISCTSILSTSSESEHYDHKVKINSMSDMSRNDHSPFIGINKFRK